MEASWTRKAYTSAIATATIIGIFILLMYFVLEANVSCVNTDGCLKSWCKADWFPGRFIDQLGKESCYRGGVSYY